MAKQPKVLGAKNTKGKGKPTKMNQKAPTKAKTKDGKKASFPSSVPKLKKDGGSTISKTVSRKKK